MPSKTSKPPPDQALQRANAAIFSLLLVAATPYVIQALFLALFLALSIPDELLNDAAFTLTWLLFAVAAAWIARPILPSLAKDITGQSVKQHVHLALLVGIGDAILNQTYFDLFVPKDDPARVSAWVQLPLYYEILVAVVAFPLIEELLYRHVCWHSVTALTSRRFVPILIGAVTLCSRSLHERASPHHRLSSRTRLWLVASVHRQGVAMRRCSCPDQRVHLLLTGERGPPGVQTGASL